jgi:hypothetical protein
LLKLVAGFAIALVLPFLMANALLTSHSTTASSPTTSIDARDPLTIDSPDNPSGATFMTHVEEPEDEDDLDLLGNPVSAAVATYKLDATGSLYETHSPRTELPHLGSPKS